MKEEIKDKERTWIDDYDDGLKDGAKYLMEVIYEGNIFNRLEFAIVLLLTPKRKLRRVLKAIDEMEMED